MRLLVVSKVMSKDKKSARSEMKGETNEAGSCVCFNNRQFWIPENAPVEACTLLAAALRHEDRRWAGRKE